MRLNLSVKETWLHRMNPSYKLIVIITLLILILCIQNFNFMVNITLVTGLLVLLFTGHPWKRLLILSSPFLLIFVSSAITMILFGKGSTPWFDWGLIHVTKESFYRGLHVGFRAVNFSLLGMLFALTTRPVMLFYSLMQQLKIPAKYAYSFLASIRLIPIMYEEFQTLKYALKVRGVRFEKGIRGIYHFVKRYSIPLLAQSIRRAQRIAVAMEAKQFSKNKQRTYYYKVRFSMVDVYFLLYYIGGISLAYWFSMVHPYVAIIDVRNLG